MGRSIDSARKCVNKWEWGGEIEWHRKLTQASRPANSAAREDLRIARSRKEDLQERVLEGSYIYLFGALPTGGGAVAGPVLAMLAGSAARSQKNVHGGGEGEKTSRLVELGELGEVSEEW